ncbi:MAG: hypothetical protein K8S98_04965 [Planctomycetes bacterium]|nr:hypothetical protein [Planctomycetota bacterium]
MHAAPQASSAKRIDLAFVAFFVLLLIAPTIDEIARERGRREPTQELRGPFPAPEAPHGVADFERWPATWERWYGDGFGLRDAFLSAHSALQFFVFQNAPAPMFIVGDDRWVFFRTEHTIDAFRGLIRVGSRAKDAWKRRLEARRDYLARMGIRYAFVIAPNKASIYPEHFPRYYTRLGATYLDQLTEYMKKNSDVTLLDLRSAFREAKARDEQGDYLYTYDGTHWTPRGGFVALRALTEHIAGEFADAPIANRAELRVQETPTTDSLLFQMYLGRWFAERARILVPLRGDGPPDEGAEAPQGDGRHVVYRRGSAHAPRVLVFHDSFVPFIERAWANYASELTLEWTHRLDPNVIANAQPDIVIDLTVERSLIDGALFDFEPPEIDPSLGFGSSRDVVGRWDPYSVDAQPDFSPELRPVARESRRGARVRVALSDEPRPIVLPVALTGDGRDLRVRVRIEVLVDGSLELRYRCPGARVAEAGVGSVRALRRGGDSYYFDLDGADIEGPLELWLSGRGTASLRDVETRRAPNAHGMRK